MILLPEQRLKALLDFYLQVIDEDYLFKLFGSQTFGQGGYSYFDSAKALFLKAKDSPRKVESNIFFNRDRQGLPTIHIALNQDLLGEGNGLGFDPDVASDEDYPTRIRETCSRTYSARFNIICTSDNTFEVLILYNVVRSLVQGNPGLLEKAGLRNSKFSGQDLILTDYLMPSNIYARGFILDCLYDIEAPSLIWKEAVAHVFLETVCGKIIDMTNNE